MAMRIKHTFHNQLRRVRLRGFTLVELLTVIAIIGILAGILIPVVGSARTSAGRAKSKAQFNGYALAITAFRNEYGHYPTGLGDSEKNINEINDFVEALSGRGMDGKIAAKGGNRRAIPFYTFAASEFEQDDDGKVLTNANIIDAFDNPNIMIVVDANNDGEVTVDDKVSKDSVKVKVAVYTNPTGDEKKNFGWQEVKSWD